MKIPENYINKYNVAVPRYTSYPPANFFTESYNSERYIESLELSNDEHPQNISLYIHIPFCSKMCHYCGCNAILMNSKSQTEAYIEAIKSEILMVKKRLKPGRRISQIHWGGGTPNSLPVEMIEDIMSVIHKNFSFIEKPEVAMECHPALLNSAYIEKLVKCKFNRFSLGVQDFRQEVLDNVNRDTPTIPVEELVNMIRSYEGTSVNLDFIYGLPFQDEKSFSETISRAIEISPNRLVTFSYAHVPWIKRAQKILEKRGLPEANKKLAMFEAGLNLLTENGYSAIGLDHFARKDDELTTALENRMLHRNFQGYCTRETTGQVYAFGTTAISQLESSYSQNTKSTAKYIELINRGELPVEKGYRLNKAEKIIRHVINETMCNHYISWSEAANIFNVSEQEIKNFVSFDEEKLNGFVSDGLIKYNSGEIVVTDMGKYFVRNIASSFDPNLKSNNKKFSKAL